MLKGKLPGPDLPSSYTYFGPYGVPKSVIKRLKDQGMTMADIKQDATSGSKRINKAAKELTAELEAQIKEAEADLAAAKEKAVAEFEHDPSYTLPDYGVDEFGDVKWMSAEAVKTFGAPLTSKLFKDWAQSHAISGTFQQSLQDTAALSKAFDEATKTTKELAKQKLLTASYLENPYDPPQATVPDKLAPSGNDKPEVKSLVAQIRQEVLDRTYHLGHKPGGVMVADLSAHPKNASHATVKLKGVSLNPGDTLSVTYSFEVKAHELNTGKLTATDIKDAINDTALMWAKWPNPAPGPTPGIPYPKWQKEMRYASYGRLAISVLWALIAIMAVIFFISAHHG